MPLVAQKSLSTKALPLLGLWRASSVRLMLAVPESPELKTRSWLYFTVPEIHNAASTLKSRGVSFEGEPHVVHQTDTYELWMAFFRDPDQHHLALMCEAPKGGEQ